MAKLALSLVIQKKAILRDAQIERSRFICVRRRLALSLHAAVFRDVRWLSARVLVRTDDSVTVILQTVLVAADDCGTGDATGEREVPVSRPRVPVHDAVGSRSRRGKQRPHFHSPRWSAKIIAPLISRRGD